jgi:hypothetical protein
MWNHHNTFSDSLGIVRKMLAMRIAVAAKELFLVDAGCRRQDLRVAFPER